MTADTARLRALLAEATPGPWERRVPTVEGVFPPHIVRVDRDDQNRRRTTILAEAFQTRGPDIDDVKAGANATLVVEAVNAFPALLDRLERAEAALAAAHFVAEHWRDALMASVDRFPGNAIGTHPLALVLAAMDGETDPVQLGLNEDAHEAFRALAASEPPAPEDQWYLGAWKTEGFPGELSPEAWERIRPELSRQPEPGETTRTLEGAVFRWMPAPEAPK